MGLAEQTRFSKGKGWEVKSLAVFSLGLIISRCEKESASDPEGLRQQVVPHQPVSHGPGNGDGLGGAERDVGTKTGARNTCWVPALNSDMG